MKKKTAAIIIASAILLIAVVGGTLAWLTAATDPVTNTFTAGDVGIKLEETKTDFKMIPGYDIAKDPKVTVTKGSEKCYVFVKIKVENNVAHGEGEGAVPFISNPYNVTTTGESCWTELTGITLGEGEKVYYREVEANADADQEFYVYAGKGEGDFKNGYVTVSGDVTKADMEKVTSNPPKITFTAYACQYNKNNTEHFEPAEAWNNAQPTTPTPGQHSGGDTP